jgi:hypothetical protein
VQLAFLQTWYILPSQNTKFLALVNASTVSYGGAKAAAGLNGTTRAQQQLGGAATGAGSSSAPIEGRRLGYNLRI